MSKTNYKELDIESALQGIEEFPEETVECETNKSEKTNIFSFANSIRMTKENIMSEENKKVFNDFMILKILSMKHDDIFICDILNDVLSRIHNADKETVYNIMLSIIPKDKKFHQYIKPKQIKDSKYVDEITSYYRIPKHIANDYILLMGEEWASIIAKCIGCDIIQSSSQRRNK